MKTFAFLREVPNENTYHYCGYVGIIEGNVPLSIQAGADYDDENSLDYKVSVHGGITFDKIFGEKVKSFPIIPLTFIPFEWYKYRVIGFDLMHHGDVSTGISKNFKYAKEQALSLMNQINNLNNEK